MVKNLTKSLSTWYSLNEKGLILYKNRLYIPNVPKIKLLILNEIHKTPYSGHPSYEKTITMLQKDYFWPNMKNELAEYIAKCLPEKFYELELQVWKDSRNMLMKGPH